MNKKSQAKPSFGIILKIIDSLRTFILFNFFRAYVMTSLSKRKGYCNHCGDCCRSCGFHKNNRCSVYSNRPLICMQDGPIDPLQIKFQGWKNCSYYWNKKTK